MIPNDFLCPITLEIMTDPVIVASGQVTFTYILMTLNSTFKKKINSPHIYSLKF